MPNMALIPEAATQILPLLLLVDGYTDAIHKLETIVGGEPIEDGRFATDHVIAKQAQFAVTGWVSDFNGGNRPLEAKAEIQRLHKAGSVMAVLSEWGNYPEMYIWRFEAPQTHRGMRFTLELQELIRVGINDNELPASQLSGPAVGRSGEVQRGRVQLLVSSPGFLEF